MSSLDRFIPNPRLRQIDHVDVGAPLEKTWQAVRHIDLARSPLVAALFSLRALPDRLRGRNASAQHMSLEDISSPESGFRILEERPGFSIALGAIGKVWRPHIDFLEVTADRFASFHEPGWVKVAWELRCEARGTGVTRIIVEVRVIATDAFSWRRFSDYFRIIGPFSHFIRRHMLSLVQRDLGAPEQWERSQPLAGDDLLPDAAGDATLGVTIAAAPAAIWPWLVQMGCRRAGWYSIDALDNAGVPSTREIVPELQAIRLGDIVPATPRGDAGFEVLLLDPPRALVLGGLYDLADGRQLRFSAPRPQRYWHVTWAFVLEPLQDARTRLHVRARAAFDTHGLNIRALVSPLIHHVMENAQLRNLRERVEAQPQRAAHNSSQPTEP